MLNIRSYSKLCDFQGIVLFFMGSLFFVALSIHYWSHVIDDAFIIYRYSYNLVKFGELTWNIGWPPVEGFTSFFWMVLNAIGIALHLDPVVVSKVVSIFAVCGMIALLVCYSAGLELYLRIVFVGSIALSPVVAFLASQGLETVFTCFLLMICAICLVKVCANSSVYLWFGMWLGAVFFAALTRPDSIFFNAGAGAGLIYVLGWRRLMSWKIVSCVILFLLASLVYISWRYFYFGYLLPNPSYIKVAGGVKFWYMGSFLLNILLPYLLLGSIVFIRFKPERFFRILAVFLSGSVVFLIYLSLILPINGHMWRYAMPLFGPLLIGLIEIFRVIKVNIDIRQTGKIAIVLFFLSWPMFQLGAADEEMAVRHPRDRVAFGKSLAGLHGRLYTTESGAPAYFSGWVTIDHLGLNSAEIAHELQSPYTVLADFNPDVMLIMYRYKAMSRHRYMFRYIHNKNYEMIAVTKKTPDWCHLIYVNPESPLYKEVKSRVCSMTGVEFLNRDIITKQIEQYYY